MWACAPQKVRPCVMLPVSGCTGQSVQKSGVRNCNTGVRTVDLWDARPPEPWTTGPPEPCDTGPPDDEFNRVPAPDDFDQSQAECEFPA